MATPAPMTLTNLSTLDILTAQFDPKTIPIKMGQVLTEQLSPGAPQPNIQFGGRNANTLSITLYFDQNAGGVTTGPAGTIALLESFISPSLNRSDIAGGGSPLILLLAPGCLAMTVKIKTIDANITQRAWDDGSITKLEAKLDMIEDARLPLFSETVRRLGLLRGTL